MSNIKKIELKVAIDDEKSKIRAMRTIAGVQGVESVAVNMKDRKITVIGEADPVYLTIKLRKFGVTELLTVGPAKEEKKPEGDKKEKLPEVPNYVYVHEPWPVVADDYNANTCTIC